MPGRAHPTNAAGTSNKNFSHGPTLGVDRPRGSYFLLCFLSRYPVPRWILHFELSDVAFNATVRTTQAVYRE